MNLTLVRGKLLTSQLFLIKVHYHKEICVFRHLLYVQLVKTTEHVSILVDSVEGRGLTAEDLGTQMPVEEYLH